MKWFMDSKVRLLLPGCIVCLMAAYALGQTEDNNADSGIISAAGPRLGTVVVVEVTFPNRDALDELVRAGYDISGVRGNVATIYASLEELERLKQTGYPLQEIERQPKPGGVDIMALAGYHSYAALTEELNIYAEAYPDICRLYTLGQSVQGRELWAMLISDNPDHEEDEPEFKYDATIHGDEALCTEMCLYFIEMLLTEYGTDERITNLVDSTVIWIVPLVNPDGRELGQRYNANGYDLNRNFPTLRMDRDWNVYDGAPLDEAGRQPETRHMMRWTAENSFVLSGTLHTGLLVVVYPYGAVRTPTDDDLLFENIAIRYSMHNLPMWNSNVYPQGIGNLARDLYIARGCSFDWLYAYMSCNEVGPELSNIKMPSASQIPQFWSDNKESMLSYLEAVHIGVRGIITDRASGEPLWAQVWVEDNSHPVFTDPNVGDYHRMLLPGTYDLTFKAPGYLPHSVNKIMVTDSHAMRVDVELLPIEALPDLYTDGEINLKDFCKLAKYWLKDEPSVDVAPLLSGDGIVDFQDLDLLVECWLMRDPHLIAHWKLDETEGTIAYDSVGDHDGTLHGDPLWQRTSGKIDGALEFDGIDNYVSTLFVLNPAEGKFSVFAWVKGGAPGQVVLSQSQTGGMNWLLADPSEGKLMTQLRSLGRFGRPLRSETIIIDGQWHRIGLTWDGSNRILYVDDVEVAKDTQGQLAAGESGLHIGAGKALEAGSFWSGLIDDVKIYNRAVTP